MKKIPSTIAKFLILMICIASLISCKNGDKGSGGFFSGGNDLEPVTATELRESWTAITSGSQATSEEVKEFYRSRSYAPVWTEEKLVEAFTSELEKAEEEGLRVEEYLTPQLQELLDLAEEKTLEERIKREVLLTNVFFTYASHLFYGKVDPTELYSLWGLKREALNTAGLLEKATETGDLVAALNSLKPEHPIYSGLKKSLQEYKVLKEKDSTATRIEMGETIEPGKEDPRIPKLAKRLQELNYIDLDSMKVDSLYGKKLEEAVKRFQEEKGLEADGIIGNSTLEELNLDNSQLYNKVLVNLERWRWYPRDLGDHYIIVNVADFKLAVVKNGDTVRTHNVIAGSKERKTPVFTDTLEYIVINPQWNIPPTIQREDIVPKASRNPSYLTNNNISVTAPNGDVLNPYDIDWSDPEIEDYRFSQSAGPSNPLGRVKIIYPNKYLIYLHDTPSKALFNRADRAESSGCVRVENAIDLSAYVVETQEPWSLEKIREQIASGETKHVKIERPIQVHHFYWTAWMGLEKTYFSDDVYNLDQELYKALTETP